MYLKNIHCKYSLLYYNKNIEKLTDMSFTPLGSENSLSDAIVFTAKSEDSSESNGDSEPSASQPSTPNFSSGFDSLEDSLTSLRKTSNAIGLTNNSDNVAEAAPLPR